MVTVAINRKNHSMLVTVFFQTDEGSHNRYFAVQEA